MIFSTSKSSNIKLKLLGLSAFFIGLSAYADTSSQNTSYQAMANVYDWGTSIDKLVLKLDQALPVQDIALDTFTVNVKRYDQRLETPLFAEGERQITKAYLSDQDGNPTNEPSEFVSLELTVGPNESLSPVLNYAERFNEWVENNYQIQQKKELKTNEGTVTDLNITKKQAPAKVALLDDFSFDKFTADGKTLTYATYSPQEDDHKNPVIIWLHGGGEGGTDPRLPLTANKAVVFASPEVQSYFDGAYVLIPQTPTRWMEGFKSDKDGTSVYQVSLTKLIKDYVANNPDIDSNKIYVGGASNGGYMTMLLLADNPQYFAAGFPICEGLNDKLITDQSLANISQTPTWFIAAKTDETLPVLDNTVPTYIRLLQMGTKNTHLSLYDKVVDTSGVYKDEAGNAYEYNGHFSWIYAFNNDMKTTIDGKEYSLMSWMAAQSR